MIAYENYRFHIAKNQYVKARTLSYKYWRHVFLSIWKELYHIQDWLNKVREYF